MTSTDPVINRYPDRSIRSRLATAAVERLAGPHLRRFADSTFGPELAAAMARVDVLARRLGTPQHAQLEPTLVGEIPAEWVHGPGVPGLRTHVILYLHGGGWFFGGLNSHRRLVSRISQAASLPALALDYRMVPEVDLSEVLDDCVLAYRWLLRDLGLAPRNIVIMGDSAGAHLAVATTLRARNLGLPVPAAVVGLSGVYDLDTAAKAAHPNAVTDPVSMTALAFVLRSVLGNADASDPDLSPIRADLTGLPPFLLTASSSEVLLSDSMVLADRLAQAGVPCTLDVWERQLHVFQGLGNLLPEARRSIAAVGQFTNHALFPRISERPSHRSAGHDPRSTST